MVVQAVHRVLPPRSAQEIEMLVDALRRMHGYRTIWLDLYDRLWHTEPEHELGRDGWRIVGTFLRPTAEQLTASVGIAMGLDRERRLALTG